ncbi:hypothetical protein J1C55_10645 [Winogradskyella sp. E313]|uniref:Uncharacterized protein n=1 Tax=Winogradskyella immobilis TaxID=2816852 RepID=A0ABS8EPA2_9FLAO|nr:hypothetical protein [Winogradskyella immobilis]
MNFKFHAKFSVVIIITFVCFTIIGTLSHELGHILVAKSLGYDTKLDYGSMTYYPKGFNELEEVKVLKKLNETYKDVDYENLSEEVKDKYKRLQSVINSKYNYGENDSLLVSIGGPAQTILTCFIGLLILYLRRKIVDFKIIDWLGVFLSLFILREVFNYIMGIYDYLIYPKSNFNGDEYRISRILGYNEWIIPSITMVFGLMISLYIIFKVIPLKFRFSFIISGLIGGVVGFSVWFGFLGRLFFPID